MSRNFKHKTQTLQPIYIDTKSELGQAIDKSLLFQLSQDTNKDVLTMDVLTADNIQTNILDLLVCLDTDGKNPAMGHIACKRVYDSPLINGQLPTRESAGQFAEIVGLLVHPSIRGHGIATELAKRITERTFATMLGVDACIASCNPASIIVLGKAGYRPMDPMQKVFELAPGFKPMIITRANFKILNDL